MKNDPPRGFWVRARGLCVLGILVGLAACGLDKVEIPPLEGPSELALSLRLTISPDVLTADGFSTASVQAEVRGPDGRPLGGRDIFFAIASGNGFFADIGSLSSTRAVTNGSGLAQVVYTTPPRTDATANQTILVTARPVGDDANGQIYRTVRLELRSAEPHLFPANPNNCQPTDTEGKGGCPFARIAIEPAGGTFTPTQEVLFQGSGSFDSPDHLGRVGTIVRFQWDFGDGGREDKPDVNHAFGFAGGYTVTLLVTDDEGASDIAAVRVVVE